MARITLGTIISDISGSIGGTTFSRNRSGLIAKSKLPGKKTLTAKQQISRQDDAYLISLWNSLTFTEKMNWKTYADINTKTNRYGQVKTLTGFNWFISVTAALLYMEQEFSPDTPVGTVPAFLPALYCVVAEEGIVVGWAEPIDSDLVDLYIYSTPPIKGTANFVNGAYRKQPRFTDDYENFFNITADWESTHGLSWPGNVDINNININVQIFAINKANGLTGQAVTSVRAFP